MFAREKKIRKCLKNKKRQNQNILICPRFYYVKLPTVSSSCHIFMICRTTAGFPISGKALPLFPLEGVGQLVQNIGKKTSKQWGGQSISPPVQIPACTIALCTPAPLPFIFTEEKGDTSSYTQTQTCINWLLRCALKGKLCYVDCTRTMTHYMPLRCVNLN